MSDENSGSAVEPSAGKGLAIAALVLGVIAAVFSFIPCIGLFSLLPGIVGIILSAISITQANVAGAPKSIAIAGLVCSLLGCLLAGWQLYLLSTASTQIMQSYEYYEQRAIMDSLGATIQTLEVQGDSAQTDQGP